MRRFATSLALALLPILMFTLNAQDVETLYIIGNDPFGGWNPEVGMQMDHDGEYFSLTVEIPSGCYFSFTQKLGSWEEIEPYRMGALSDGFALTPELQGEIIQCSNWGENVNYAFVTQVKASYTITVDPVNCLMLFNCTPGDTDPKPEPDGNIYILGTVNGNSWAPNVGIKMDKVSENLFTANVTITGNSGNFNFTRALSVMPNDWGGIAPYRFGSVSGNVMLNDVLGVAQQLGAEGDSQNLFELLEGTYKLTLDLEARTLVADTISTSSAGIFMVGTLNDWDPLTGIPLESEDGNIFTYTTTLSGEVYFIFTNAQLAWSVINNGEHRFGPANGDTRITANEYITTQLTGDTGAYIFDAGEHESEFTFTFDLQNLKFRIEGSKVGDVNGDGAIDGNDLNMLINIILGKETANDAANVDGEGDVDGNDLNALINILLGK